MNGTANIYPSGFRYTDETTVGDPPDPIQTTAVRSGFDVVQAAAVNIEDGSGAAQSVTLLVRIDRASDDGNTVASVRETDIEIPGNGSTFRSGREIGLPNGFVLEPDTRIVLFVGSTSGTATLDASITRARYAGEGAREAARSITQR